MATKVYSAWNLQQIPLQQLVLESLATASRPNPGVAGYIYFDTTLGYPMVCIVAGSPGTWVKAGVTAITDADIASGAAIALSKLAVDPLARANHTGSQLASTVSNFDTQVRTSRLDQMAAPTSAVGMGGQRVTNLADPSSSTDATTQQWVQNLVDTRVLGQDWKASVRLRAASNVTVSSPGTTIDGVTMVAGDRVLLAAQTAPAENGIYTWSAAGSALVRATDADTSADVTAGLTVPVETGTSADTIWLLTTDNPITLGTTGLAFTQISAAGAYTAGTGLTLTGNQFTLTVPVVVASGGTGATTAVNARANLNVPQRGYAGDVGALTAGVGLAIAHGLGTADLVVMVRDKSSGAGVEIDMVVDATNITLTSAISVLSGVLRVVALPAA